MREAGRYSGAYRGGEAGPTIQPGRAPPKRKDDDKLSVSMLMMHVRHMRMPMLHPRMPVSVGVRFTGRITG